MRVRKTAGVVLAATILGTTVPRLAQATRVTATCPASQADKTVFFYNDAGKSESAPICGLLDSKTRTDARALFASSVDRIKAAQGPSNSWLKEYVQTNYRAIEALGLALDAQRLESPKLGEDLNVLAAKMGQVTKANLEIDYLQDELKIERDYLLELGGGHCAVFRCKHQSHHRFRYGVK